MEGLSKLSAVCQLKRMDWPQVGTVTVAEHEYSSELFVIQRMLVLPLNCYFCDVAMYDLGPNPDHEKLTEVV